MTDETVSELAERCENFLRTARHDAGCLAIKGAHYGNESCDCGLIKARGAAILLRSKLG